MVNPEGGPSPEEMGIQSGDAEISPEDTRDAKLESFRKRALAILGEGNAKWIEGRSLYHIGRRLDDWRNTQKKQNPDDPQFEKNPALAEKVHLAIELQDEMAEILRQIEEKRIEI